MTKIKICGLKRVEDIKTANDLELDYIGFIFAKKSKRYVSVEEADALKKLLNPEIKAVGVFVNEDENIILDLVKRGIIDVVQLHGSEDEDYVERIKKKAGCTVFKAFSINSEEDVKKANESKADLVLLDSGTGGTGQTFDWQLLSDIKRDYFLAGGIDENNVHKAITSLKPYAVDVSSGVETDGFKDEKKMRNLVRIIREVR